MSESYDRDLIGYGAQPARSEVAERRAPRASTSS